MFSEVARSKLDFFAFFGSLPGLIPGIYIFMKSSENVVNVWCLVFTAIFHDLRRREHFVCCYVTKSLIQ